MIDLSNIGRYKENNRIEAKRALGGLPESIWETYSSFANTLGGILLLGVVEEKDKTLHPIDLPDPESLVEEFWEIVNNPSRTSVNILSERHVTIEKVDGKHIIVIVVPRAHRYDKPVYLDGNIYDTYRRTGEGDYRCSREEVAAMVRDASRKTQDMNVLENMGMEVLDYDTVHAYRKRMETLRPGHVWEELSDREFLYRLGAVGEENGKIHPTGAGLLMFGREKEIIKEYPYYFLDYQEQMENDTRFTYRIISSSGEWSGNLYDFYFRVYRKISRGIKIPSKITEENFREDTPVHEALKEALINCIVNADYYGRQGLVIVKKKERITLSNPGGFRIDVERARSGGISDPRNGALVKMFNLVDIGESLGSGIPNIYKVWKEQGWEMPVIEEHFKPDRITLSLIVEKSGRNARRFITDKRKEKEIQKNILIEYMTEHVTMTAGQAAAILNIRHEDAEKMMISLEENGIAVKGDSDRYRLKA